MVSTGRTTSFAELMGGLPLLMGELLAATPGWCAIMMDVDLNRSLEFARTAADLELFAVSFGHDWGLRERTHWVAKGWVANDEFPRCFGRCLPGPAAAEASAAILETLAVAFPGFGPPMQVELLGWPQDQLPAFFRRAGSPRRWIHHAGGVASGCSDG
jgi:hypothetical protein